MLDKPAPRTRNERDAAKPPASAAKTAKLTSVYRIGFTQTRHSELSLIQYSCHAFRHFASRCNEWPDDAVKVKASDGEAVSSGDRRRRADRPGAGGAARLARHFVRAGRSSQRGACHPQGPVPDPSFGRAFLLL